MTKAKLDGQIIDIPDNATISQAMGDVTLIWDICGRVELGRRMLCEKCRNIPRAKGCQKLFIAGRIKSQPEMPLVELPNGESFYVDEIIS